VIFVLLVIDSLGEKMIVQENKALKLCVVVQTVIPALRRLRQEGHKFEANLGYKAKPCLKETKMSQSSP
jgi:hypothetical protein